MEHASYPARRVEVWSHSTAISDTTTQRHEKDEDKVYYSSCPVFIRLQRSGRGAKRSKRAKTS
jgi:hypothetical protein